MSFTVRKSSEFVTIVLYVFFLRNQKLLFIIIINRNLWQKYKDLSIYYAIYDVNNMPHIHEKTRERDAISPAGHFINIVYVSSCSFDAGTESEM